MMRGIIAKLMEKSRISKKYADKNTDDACIFFAKIRNFPPDGAIIRLA